MFRNGDGRLRRVIREAFLAVKIQERSGLE
jgi:hypothetical protein